MAMYAFAGLCMPMYDYVWLFMAMYVYVWLFMAMYDYVWLYVTIFGYVWLWKQKFNFFHMNQMNVFKIFKLFNKPDYPYLCLPLFTFFYLCSNDASMHKFCACSVSNLYSLEYRTWHWTKKGNVKMFTSSKKIFFIGY